MGTIFGRPTRASRWICAATLVLAALFSQGGGARAWGKLGHRAISAVAEHKLHPAALRSVRELLDSGETLADASVWADDHRKDIAGSGAWHFVDVPIREPSYRSIFCAETGCVVSKTSDEIRLLQGPSPSSSTMQRSQMLRLLVHLIEDLHQPLHVADRGDRGGNDLPVWFFGEPTNLHRVWDEGLLEAYSLEESVWIDAIEAFATPARSRTWSNLSVDDWANESLAAGREAYRSPTTGLPLPPGAILRDTYLEHSFPAVRLRLAQAAVRVADVLNRAFE